MPGLIYKKGPHRKTVGPIRSVRATYSFPALVTVIAQSGQTISHILQAVQGTSCLTWGVGVPYTPKLCDHSKVLIAHFSIQRPQPLHKGGNTVQTAFGPVIVIPFSVMDTGKSLLPFGHNLFDQLSAPLQGFIVQVAQFRVLLKLITQFLVQRFFGLIHGQHPGSLEGGT